MFKLLLIISIYAWNKCSKDKPFKILNNCTNACPNNSILNIESKKCELDMSSCWIYSYDVNNNKIKCLFCMKNFYLYKEYCYQYNKDFVFINPLTKSNNLSKYQNIPFKILFKNIIGFNVKNYFFAKYKYLIEFKINKICFINNKEYLQKNTILKKFINKNIKDNYFILNKNLFRDTKKYDMFELIFIIKDHNLVPLFINYFYFNISFIDFDILILDKKRNITKKLNQYEINYFKINNIRTNHKENLILKIEEIIIGDKIKTNLIYFKYLDIWLFENDFYIEFIPNFIAPKKIFNIKYKISIIGNNQFKFKIFEINSTDLYLINSNYWQNIFNYDLFLKDIYFNFIYNIVKLNTGFKNFIEGFHNLHQVKSNIIVKIKNNYKNNKFNYKCDINCNYPNKCVYTNNIMKFECKCKKKSWRGKLCKTSKYNIILLKKLFFKLRSVKSSNFLWNINKIKVFLILSEYFNNSSYFKVAKDLLYEILNINISINNNILNKLLEIRLKIQILNQNFNLKNDYDFDMKIFKLINNNINLLGIKNFYEYNFDGYYCSIFNMNYLKNQNLNKIKFFNFEDNLFKILNLNKNNNFYFVFIFNNLESFDNNKFNLIHNLWFKIINSSGIEYDDKNIYSLINFNYLIDSEWLYTNKIIETNYGGKSNLKKYFEDIDLNNYNKNFIKNLDIVLNYYNLLSFNYVKKQIFKNKIFNNINIGNYYLLLGNKKFIYNNNSINIKLSKIYNKELCLYFYFKSNEKTYFDPENEYYSLLNVNKNHYNSYIIYIIINMTIFLFFLIIIICRSHKKWIIINDKFLLIKEYEEKILNLRKFINFQSIVLIQWVYNYCSRFERINKLLFLLLNLHFSFIMGFFVYIIIYPLYDTKDVWNLKINALFSWVCIIFIQILTSYVGYYFNYSINISKKINNIKLRRFFKKISYTSMSILLVVILIVTFSLIYEIFKIFEKYNYNSEIFLFFMMFVYLFDWILINFLEFILSFAYLKYNEINIFEKKLFYRGFSLYDQNDFILKKLIKERKKYELFFEGLKNNKNK